MNAREIKAGDIAQLPPLAKIAFIARCPRIVWNLAPQHFKSSLAPILEEALRIVERWGSDAEEWALAAMGCRFEPHVRTQEMQRAASKVDEFRVYAEAGGSGFEGALSQAILSAVNAALAIADRKSNADDLAYDAYRQTQAAAKEASRCLPSLSAASESFMERANRDFERLHEHSMKMLGDREQHWGGATAPEWFDSQL
jgi:hypothetical protein